MQFSQNSDHFLQNSLLYWENSVLKMQKLNCSEIFIAWIAWLHSVPPKKAWHHKIFFFKPFPPALCLSAPVLASSFQFGWMLAWAAWRAACVSPPSPSLHTSWRFQEGNCHGLSRRAPCHTSSWTFCTLQPNSPNPGVSGMPLTTWDCWIQPRRRLLLWWTPAGFSSSFSSFSLSSSFSCCLSFCPWPLSDPPLYTVWKYESMRKCSRWCVQYVFLRR